MASLNELHGHLIRASDTHILSDKSSSTLYHHIELERRMLLSLMSTVQEHIAHEENDRRDDNKDSRAKKRA